MKKRVLALLCLAVAAMLLVAPLATAAASIRDSGLGGKLKTRINKKTTNLSITTDNYTSFETFYLLNYVNGQAQLLFSDGMRVWVEMSEDEVNALWGRTGVLCFLNGEPVVNISTASLPTPPLSYGLLEEDLTVDIDGEDVTFEKGSIIPVGYDEEGSAYLRLPGGERIPLGDAGFTAIASPYTPPEPEHNVSVGDEETLAPAATVYPTSPP